MKPLKYGNRRVIVPDTADISANFYQNPRDMNLLQEALDELTAQETQGGDQPWDHDGGLQFTYDLGGTVTLRNNVVEVVPREQRVWGVHVAHTARRPQLSPFVRRMVWPEAHEFTILLVGSPKSPRLVRAYVGEERPPLPWMNSARSERRTSERFWTTHAYVFARNLIRGQHSVMPPQWYRDLVH